MKKSLSLLLALTLVFGLFASMASAAETELTTAQKYQWLLDEGVLKGDTSGDPNLGGKLNRAQFATIIAALAGLEPATSGQTFKDVLPSQWWYGDIEAVAQEGFVNGTGGGKYSPKADVTLEAVIKVAVLLRGLKPVDGAVVAGTSTWAGPYFKAAIDSGLIAESAAAAAKQPATRGQTIDVGYKVFVEISVPQVVKATVVDAKTIEVVFSDDTAAQKFTVDALTPNKEETRTITYKEKTYDVKVTWAVSAQATDVVAIDSTTVKVSFDNAVTATASSFTLVDASNAAVAISSVTSADAGKVAVLKTAALTIGNKYTLTFGGKSFDVVATLANDETKPALSGAVAVTGELVRATFSTRNINKDTLIAANFTLDAGSVTAVELDTATMAAAGQEGNTVVLLTVSGIASGKAYTLTSKNIASYEGAVATTSTAAFAGKDADKDAPKIAGAASEGGYQVVVTFTEDGKLDASALVAANYTITSSLGALEVKSAAFRKNELGNNVVVLTTADQKSGIAYTLSVNNISDGKNTQTTAATAVFAGVDKVTNQSVFGALATDARKVEVTFNYEANATALVATNYTITTTGGTVTVESAAFKADTSEVDGLNQKKVILTLAAATPLKSGSAYELTVSTAVQDTQNQGLKEAAKVVFAGKDADTTFAGGTTAASFDKNTVTVTFGEAVDRASALALANYSISTLGYPSSVTLNAAGTVATLKVASQTAGNSYTITLNNIKDEAGNAIAANTKVTFTGRGDVVNKLTVTSVEALSKTLLKVTFNQPLVTGVVDTSKFTLTANPTNGAYTFGAVNAVNDQNYILVTVGTTPLNSSTIYTFSIAETGSGLSAYRTGHTLSSTASERSGQFVGKNNDVATVNATGAIPLDKTHVKVLFDQALNVIADNIEANTLVLYTKSDLTGASITNTSGVGLHKIVDGGKAIIFEVGALADDTIYYAKLNRQYDSPAVNIGTTEGAVLATESATDLYKKLQVVTGKLAAASDTKLDIASAVQIDDNTLRVTFNVDTNQGLVKTDVSIGNEKGVNLVTVKHVEFTDAKTANIYFSSASPSPLNNPNGIQYVTITAGNLKTLVGNSSTFGDGLNSESFAKNAATNAKPTIAMVEALTSNLIRVTASEKVFSAADSTTQLVAADFVIINRDTTPFTQYDPTTPAPAQYTIETTDNKVFYIKLTGALTFAAGTNYQIGFGADVYGIDGVVKADVFAPASSTTANSVNFGGV